MVAANPFPLASLPMAAVAVALRRLLPTASQTLLLAASLDASKGAVAWSTWRASHDLQATLANDRVGVKGMLPLLAYALEQNGAIVTADDLSLLRMARYREQLRMERYYTILRQTLAILREGGVRVILLKGAALASAAYPEPTLRHNHDIDLLIQPRDLPHAASLLLAHDFRYSASPLPLAQAEASGDLQLDHASGLPVVLHTRLFRTDYTGIGLDDAWQSAVAWGDEPPAMMLAPEWELVHILGAVIGARARVTWVCDAYYLMAANPAMDWGRVCEIAGQSGLAMVVYALLAYLREEHQSPIPSFVADHLQRYFARASRADYEQLLQSARSQNRASYGDLFSAASSWQERFFLLRWMLLPLPTMAQRQQLTGWQLPLFYLRRLLRYLARRAAFTKSVHHRVQGSNLYMLQI